jgi:hypothetical protein
MLLRPAATVDAKLGTRPGQSRLWSPPLGHTLTARGSTGRLPGWAAHDRVPPSCPSMPEQNSPGEDDDSFGSLAAVKLLPLALRGAAMATLRPCVQLPCGGCLSVCAHLRLAAHSFHNRPPPASSSCLAWPGLTVLCSSSDCVPASRGRAASIVLSSLKVPAGCGD